MKADGSLNEKFPGGVKEQAGKLKKEGFVIESNGGKGNKLVVKDFEKYLARI